MTKVFYKSFLKLSVFITITLSTQLFAVNTNIQTLQACSSSNYEKIYNFTPLCIGDEKIELINNLNTYGSNNAEYQTKGNNFSKIISLDENNSIIWQITTKEGLTYTYKDLTKDSSNNALFDNKRLKITSIKDTANNTITLPYKSSEIIFDYEYSTNNEPLLSQITTSTESGTAYYGISYDTNNTATITTLQAPKNTSVILSKKYDYDVNLRELRESISGLGIESRIKKYEYGDTSSNKIIKIINPLGQIQTKTYDENNNLISFVDENSLTTTWEYDVNNRKIKETRPDSTTTTYVYSTNDLINNASYKLLITEKGQPNITKYYDNKKRLIQTEKLAFNHRNILEDITYDDGRISSYSMPYFKGEKPYFIYITYDEKNRVISLDKPGLNEQRLITSYTYNDTTTVTYPDGKTKIINNDGTNTNLQYKYDVIGNLIETTDDLNRKVLYSYDLLNRLVKKEIFSNNANEAENIVYYVYDRANNGQGKLAYEKSKEYKKEYFYDDFSRIKADKVYLGNKTFATQYSYTPESKLEKTISPDGFVTINEYNELGYLSAIKSPKKDSVELDFNALKELISDNLTNEYNLYVQYYDLKSKVNFYTYKKELYTTLSTEYANIDTQIQAQLISISALLDETISLLNSNITEYEKYLTNYKKIRNNYLLPKATENSAEENFKWLKDTFNSRSKDYLSLSTTYIDKASNLLEGIITNPELLNSKLNIDKKLINNYKDEATSISDYAQSLLSQSNNYNIQYEALKKGLGGTQQNGYLGTFASDEYKYFYKILDTDPLGRVTNEILGNGLVTKRVYDPSSGNLLRITTGYYGNNDIKDIQYTYDTNNNLTVKYDLNNKFTQSYKYNEKNRLVSASSVGESFYSNIAYNYVDVIDSQYTYNNAENKFTNKTTNLSITVNEPNIIKDGLLTQDTLYAADKSSYKATRTNGDKISTTYKVGKNFKYTVDDEGTKYKNYIYVNGQLIAIHDEDNISDLSIPNNYYIHKDLFGSIDIITNQSALVEKSISYRPFGEQSDITWTTLEENDNLTNIGFKGYEKNQFNLLDINGYAYDPKVAKTLTDESINILDDNSSEFFMYSSPTKYVDKTMDNWYKNFINIFDMKKLLSNDDPLFNLEIKKDIYSLSSLANVYIGSTPPDDSSLIWYKPNENGGLDISIFNGTSWESKGTTGSLDTTGTITASSLEQLNNMPCFYKDLGFVDSGSSKIPYTCSTSQKWELGGIFSGTFDMLDLVSKYQTALSGSKINASTQNGEYSGTKEFTKIGEYWVDASNNYIASDTLANIIPKTNMNLNSIAFALKDSSSLYILKKLDVPTQNMKWVYLANGFNDIVLNYNFIETVDGGYVLDKKSNNFFKQTNNVWTSLDNKIQLSSSSSGRDIFTNFNKEYRYYLVNNDCTDTSCYGTVENNYYAGIKFDNLFMYNYLSTGKNKNGLVDAIPQESIEEMYTNGINSVIFDNKVYTKQIDNKNNITYKREDDTYITKLGAEIPSSFVQNGILNLPTNYDSSVAVFNTNALVLPTYTQATNWADAPDNVQVMVNNTIFTHKVNGNIDFWTNNTSGDGQESATRIFTKGDRGNLPLITHSLEVLTKEVGTQNRYTDAGVTSSIDGTFKQWYYSVSGTIFNNLLDAKLVNAKFGDENFDDEIVNGGWSIDLNTIFVDSNNTVGTLAKRTPNKYCKEQVVNFNAYFGHGKKSRICWKTKGYQGTKIPSWLKSGTSAVSSYGGIDSSQNCKHYSYYRVKYTYYVTGNCPVYGADVWYK
ncbi:RHS repeat domain-containing protein [Arcobacter sp. F2176]|uniref:RHS repeat domain-containing protein n=1 Tax=Arcobacter sp. F2176 TaxID=2044511 RepID=UPI00100BD76D|nr:RHS repeat domain-containing protein [Arcobacter sp. F2176]RXJ79037.1 hypothetical protein CRU95_15280 [Arcobacter sp. F2176]